MSNQEWVVLVATRAPGVCTGVGVNLSGLTYRDAAVLAGDRNAANTDANVYYWPALRVAGKPGGWDTKPARDVFEARDHNAAEFARLAV